jgi:hypothetical protein
MTRAAPALKTLIRQVAERDEDAAIELRDVDGFGRARTALFGDVTSEWLGPIIQHLTDKRIASWGFDEAVLYVTVVSGRPADDPSDFPLGRVEKVLEEPEYVDDGSFSAKQQRADELDAMKAGELREEYPEHADLPNKAAIVEAVLAEEYPD